MLAFGTATGIAVSRTIVSDLFPDSMARMLAQLAIVAVVVERVGAVIGGFLTAWFGWRSVFARPDRDGRRGGLVHLEAPAGDAPGDAARRRPCARWRAWRARCCASRGT